MFKNWIEQLKDARFKLAIDTYCKTFKEQPEILMNYWIPASENKNFLLKDEVWRKLQNSISYKTDTLEKVINFAKRTNRKIEPLITDFIAGNKVQYPTIIVYPDKTINLIDGEIRLMICRCLKIIPRVNMIFVDKKHYVKDKLKKYAKDGLHAHFTRVMKVGIKPMSNYSSSDNWAYKSTMTPNGIYAYPIKAILNSEYDVSQGSNFPYIFILRQRGNFINDMHKDLTEKNNEAVYDLAVKYENELTENGISTARSGQFDVVGEWVNVIETKCANYAEEFWFGTEAIARKYAKAKKLSNVTQVWNNILRELGYSGFANISKPKLIYSGEPIQSFFLTSNDFTIEDVLYQHNEM